MNRMLLSLLFIVSLTSSVFAENVVKKETHSKIDNQLVPVGDKGKYEYAYKKFNIGANLFLLPADIISVSTSMAVTDNVAIRVGLATNLSSDTEKDNQKVFGNIGAPIYFKKMYSGFFIEPGLDSSAGMYAMGGYHWMWDSNFNIFAGVGGGRKGPSGYLQVAYAFDSF